MKRLEIELPWSAEALRTVTAELARAHIRITPPETFDDGSPSDILRAAGLLPIQDRHTHRQIRDVLEPHLKERLAELAIDAVEYRFETSSVQMYQIEIEAKHPNSAAVLHSCSLALQSDFGAMLRPWPYGKLATGTAVERLLRTNELSPLLVSDHLIGAQAALLLEDRLRQ